MKCIKCGHSFNAEKCDNICPKCSTYNREDNYRSYIEQESNPTPAHAFSFHREPDADKLFDLVDESIPRSIQNKFKANVRTDGKKKPMSAGRIVALIIVAINIIPLVLSLLFSLLEHGFDLLYYLL